MRRPLIERVVSELAAFERPSASEGERRAAEWLARELEAANATKKGSEEMHQESSGHRPSENIAAVVRAQSSLPSATAHCPRTVKIEG